MGLKIAITSTVSWPYVRRGSRITYELAEYLARQGHEVNYISMKPGDVSRKKIQDGVHVEYLRLIEHPLLTIGKIHKFDTFSLSCLRSLLAKDYDIVQTTFPMDAFAASIHKSLTGTPFVHYMFDRFYPRYYITNFGKLVFKRCIKTASRIGTISNFIKNDLKQKFDIEGTVISGAVDIEHFTLCKNKDIGSPYILSTSSLIEPRKRIALLVKAFECLLGHVPNAILKLSGHTLPEINTVLLDSVTSRTRKSIEILGVGRREGLPELYRNAAISVLPSVNEAFGLVILESLASGTPVVGTRSGGIPDILNDPKIGVLFDERGGPEELCKALLKGMELSRDPETWIRCRHHAERYSWSNIGPLYEKLYSEVLDGKQQKKTGIVIKKNEKKRNPVHTESRGGYSNGKSNATLLASLFNDALDELDIDYLNYYRFDLYKPFCMFIGGWFLKSGLREGTLLVIGTFMLPLKIFLEKCGFTVRGIAITQRREPSGEPENPMHMSDFLSLKDISGNYDAIICDDILKYDEFPGRILQILKGKLKFQGKLLLTTENAVNWKSRLPLFRGKNVYPDKTLLDEATSIKIENRKANSWNYKLNDIEKVVSDSGFSITHSNYIIKEKAIEGNLLPTPICQYIYKNLYYFMQKTFPRLRSHIFIAANKNSVL